MDLQLIYRDLQWHRREADASPSSQGAVERLTKQWEAVEAAAKQLGLTEETVLRLASYTEDYLHTGSYLGFESPEAVGDVIWDTGEQCWAVRLKEEDWFPACEHCSPEYAVQGLSGYLTDVEARAYAKLLLLPRP